MGERPPGRSKVSADSIRAMRGYLADSNVQVASLAVFALVNGLATAVALVLILQVAIGLSEGQSTDELTIQGAGLSFTAPLPALLVAVAVAAAAVVLFTGLTAWTSARISAGVMNRLRRTTASDFLHADWSVVAGEKSGELQEVLSGQVLRVAMASQFFSQGAVALFNFAALMAVAIAVNPITAGAMALVGVALFVLLRPVSSAAKRQARKGVQANVTYAGAIAETVALAEEIHTFGVADPVSAKLDGLVDEVGEPYRVGRFYNRLLPGLYSGVALAVVALGLAVAAGVGLDDLATAGTVVVLLVRSLSYGQVAQGSYHNLVELLPSAERLEAQQAQYRSANRVDGPVALQGVERIDLVGVGFSYAPGQPVLTDINVSLERPETLGVIGASGAGKSTLSSLLLRLQQPSEGQFLVNGQPASAYSSASWTRKVAVVSQIPHLFSGTVRENIAFWRPDLDDDAIVAAAKLAQIHDEIERWPDGYDTHTGPRATNLSGGQRQRICIARALAGSPDLLVLDEPTSALDLASEARFRDAMATIRSSMILVVITHRLSTLELCDRVLVLRDGHVEGLESAERLRTDSPFLAETLRVAGIA